MARLFRVLAVLIALFPASAPAQEGPTRYVTIPFQGDFEALFKRRLQLAEEISPLQRVLDQIKRDPKKFNLDAAKLKQLDLDNPAFRDMLKSMVDKHKSGASISAHELDGLKGALEKMKPPGAKVSLPTNPAVAGEPPSAAAKPAGPADLPEPHADALDRLMRDFVDRAGESKIGDWLRESPAFQNGLKDLRALANFEKAPSLWGVANLPEHLRWTEKLDLRFGDGFLSSLKNLSLPDLPRVHAPDINFGGWSLPTVPLPALGRAGGASIGGALLWGVVVVGTVILAWQIARGLKRAGAVRASTAILGPWPVNPAHVETREQLVQAFDYLALLSLGQKVRSWNHLAIARKLATPPHHASAAADLARLYEQARYTTGPERLAPADQAAVRQHLSQLAGVPAS